MEAYLTITEVSAFLKLSKQTLQRYVLRKEIPFHKIRKVIRFRLSEIEQWIENGGTQDAYSGSSDAEPDLFETTEDRKHDRY